MQKILRCKAVLLQVESCSLSSYKLYFSLCDFHLKHQLRSCCGALQLCWLGGFMPSFLWGCQAYTVRHHRFSVRYYTVRFIQQQEFGLKYDQSSTLQFHNSNICLYWYGPGWGDVKSKSPVLEGQQVVSRTSPKTLGPGVKIRTVVPAPSYAGERRSEMQGIRHSQV